VVTGDRAVAKGPARAWRQLFTRPFRIPRLTPYVPRPDDPAIFWFNSEREDIVREVVRRVVERFVHDERPLEYVLNEVAYEEVKRLEQQRDEEAADSLGFWRDILRRVGRMSDAQRKDLLKSICERMAWDIAGNFDPRVYWFATAAVPRLLTAVMKPSAIPRDLFTFGAGHRALDDMLRSEGHIEQLRRLATRGTLVFVPTHSSNLDSIALGYCLMREQLPPVVYGAGKNLFTNPIISFFMHNLGAYRVDRRIRANLYKDVLKTYSCVLIERGYHSLFFPGGTRSRSGMVERRLKLGLAGTAIEAYARNRVRGITRPIFFVPTTINYALVLEAETLIEDWLKEAGKARYIIDDDEFSQIDRWLAFFRRVAQMQSACVIRFGPPLDPFCNPVDEEGHSLAPDGRTIEPGTYVLRRGVPTLDAVRDAAYTRELGRTLVQIYERETVLMATHLVAHILFRRLVRATPGVDLFGRLRYRGEVVVPREELAAEVGRARDRLVALEAEGVVHLGDFGRGSDPTELVTRVIDAWNGYHRRTIVVVHDGQVIAEDPTMLLYYQNRLVAYAEQIAGPADLPAAREIARLGG